MRKEDTLDVGMSAGAVVADGVAIFLGILFATWLRFDSGLPVPLGSPPDRYTAYPLAAILGALLMLFIYRSLGLFVRPQLGSFGDKIPRIVRATGLGLLFLMVLAFVFKNRYEFSLGVIIISFFTILACVLIERAVLFDIEIRVAKNSTTANRVMILGTNAVAAHLGRAVSGEPRLRSEIAGFLRTDLEEPDAGIPAEKVCGTVQELGRYVEDRRVDQVIMAESNVDHDELLGIVLLCERNMVGFRLVPDIFHILTGGVEIQTVDDVPLLGIGKWPLDNPWRQLLKRLEDILGAVVGLVVFAGVIAAAAIAIRRTSPGPVFYKQERCGKKGKIFTLYKLRTMAEGAETDSGPVWASEDDPRRTKVGVFLRSRNIDELPQFWNVLKGDMSLVGPRPERPHFVEQFKEDIGRYMWRHVSKPGMTGWAQVNGLRGNTSIEERIKYDLYYLENWSLSFDFKILLKTLFARRNAY